VPKITPCLWFNDNAAEAVRLTYLSCFRGVRRQQLVSLASVDLSRFIRLG
jgi:predicted 3-demethylubiquinone-9 3-methyltransferase (glyoxalase superfamily)